MPDRYVPLYLHSHYSLLRALPKIPDLIDVVKEAGLQALALTDISNLYGAIEFYKECQSAGIRAIIGVDMLREHGQRIALLAENETGYKNLLALVSAAHLHAPEHAEEPFVTDQMLAQHAEGLIAIIPYRQGGIMTALAARDPDRARAYLRDLQRFFDADHLYLGVARHSLRDRARAASVHAFGAEEHMPVVVAQEVRYLKPEDRRAWETLQAIENKGGEDEGDIADDEEDFSFKDTAALQKLFDDMPEALALTNTIAERCNLSLTLGNWVFPAFPIPQGATFESELRRLIEDGIEKRGLTDDPTVRERVEYEYGIILKKGYAPYFLVVADLLAFARTHGILTTIRGSVAGSLVTYVTGITNVNPLEYKLPFERFLNPERPSAPDIDMDYADNRRDEVIDYARRKYGSDHVAQIGTFGTMLARGVVRDVARALRYPYGLGDRIAKEIPFGSQGFPMTLNRALAESPEFAKMYKAEREVREIVDLGRRIEGSARHVGIHAAGIVIAPKPLTEFVPLQKDPKGGKIITQYDMHAVEDAGLLKFDFLGIRNLAILAHSVALVKQSRGHTISIENIPIDDQKTFALLASGQTEGLFQLNGSGMTRFLKELRPSTIHDINAMVALYRPGPMENIPQYIERKHNPRLVQYLDPRMRDYLEFSHGVIVYQDDVLLTAITLGGYSWLEADKLRKAMGKKIPEVMAAEKEKLVKGFIEYGKLTPALAEKIWKLIEPFAAYGFNKAHAASYGRVAYQTAYMKANYPVEYMTAVLTAEAGDIETVSIMVGECKRMGIPVLPPDVNESQGDFTVMCGDDGMPNAIRFGLYSIKNFGRGIADSIIEERTRGGMFSSLSSFLTRVKDHGLNKKALESLIQCGALDRLGERGTMLDNLDRILQFHRDASAEQTHDSLFAGTGVENTLALPPAPDVTLEQKLAWEKELLGLYVSGHPLDHAAKKLKTPPTPFSAIRTKLMPGMTVVTAGVIEDLRVILTKKGEQMAFVKLSDLDSSLEAVIFPEDFTDIRTHMKAGAVIALKGRISNRGGELSLVAEKVKTL